MQTPDPAEIEHAALERAGSEHVGIARVPGGVAVPDAAFDLDVVRIQTGEKIIPPALQGPVTQFHLRTGGGFDVRIGAQRQRSADPVESLRDVQVPSPVESRLKCRGVVRPAVADRAEGSDIAEFPHDRLRAVCRTFDFDTIIAQSPRTVKDKRPPGTKNGACLLPHFRA